MNGFKNTFISRNFGKIVIVWMSLIQLGGFYNIPLLSSEAIIIVMVVFFLRIIYLSRFSDLSLNMARILLWFSWDLSMVVLPSALFRFYSDVAYPSIDLVISASDVNFSICIGGLVLMIHFLASYGFKNMHYARFDYVPNYGYFRFVVLSITLFFIILIALFAAKFFGTGVLGLEGNRLPYKLSGMINYIAYYFPFFFYLFLLDGIFKFKKNFIFALIPITFIGIAQAYVSLSKASVIVPFAIFIIYIFMARKATNFKVGFLSALLIMGFIIGSFMTSYRDSLHTIKARDISELTADYGPLEYVHRIFREGMLFQKVHAFEQTTSLSDALKENGYNPSDLHTYAIDRHDPNSMHSSGCSSLVSAYCFGLFFVPIAAFLMSIITVLIDYWMAKTKTIFCSVMIRTFFVYYLIIYMFNLALVQFIIPLFSKSANFIVGTLIPLSIIATYLLYVKLFYKRVEVYE